MKTTSVLLLMMGVALPVAFAYCPATFEVLSGACLKVVENPSGFMTSPTLPWQEAREKCNAMGTDLAILEDEGLLRHVSAYIKEHFSGLFSWSIWIGGRRQNGIWRWVNGDKISVTSPIWMPHSASTGEEDDYVRLVAGTNDVLRLSQAGDGKAIGYICEFR